VTAALALAVARADCPVCHRSVRRDGLASHIRRCPQRYPCSWCHAGARRPCRATSSGLPLEAGIYHSPRRALAKRKAEAS